jgi:hypothetical protein
MAVPQEHTLRQIAEFKHKLRWTNAKVAEWAGVSERTVQRWLRDTEYAKVEEAFQQENREAAKARITGMADDIIQSLYEIGTGSQYGAMARVNALKTLGEWVGLHEMKEDAKGDDREETLEILRMLSTRPQPVAYLPPPLPGGKLPEEFIAEAVIVPDNDEGNDDAARLIMEAVERKEEG